MKSLGINDFSPKGGRIVVLAAALAIATLAAFSIGCKKRDRITSTNSSFSVTPPAATVLRTESLTLTARAGSNAISPTWNVSPIGNLNTSIGSSVVFTSTALGDTYVTAVFDGVMSTVRIAVVTHKPNQTGKFDIYTDRGLPAGTDVDSDIIVGEAGTPLTLAEVSTGFAPEGIRYQRATNADSDDFWGVTLGATHSRDLSSSFTGATRLKFALRFNRDLVGGEGFRVVVEDAGGAEPAYVLVPGNGNDFLQTADNIWQEVSLPLSHWPGLDFTQVRVPFVIVANGIVGTVDFDVDAVRWEN